MDEKSAFVNLGTFECLYQRRKGEYVKMWQKVLIWKSEVRIELMWYFYHLHTFGDFSWKWMFIGCIWTGVEKSLTIVIFFVFCVECGIIGKVAICNKSVFLCSWLKLTFSTRHVFCRILYNCAESKDKLSELFQVRSWGLLLLSEKNTLHNNISQEIMIMIMFLQDRVQKWWKYRQFWGLFQDPCWVL